MELSSVKDAFERVTKKQKLSVSKSQEVIEQFSQQIEQALTGIQSIQDSASPTDYKPILNELKAKATQIAPLLEGPQKELNISLTKYPKLLEKTFIPDISKSYRNIDYDIPTINQIIASHFYHEGQFDIGDCFVNETDESEADANKTSHQEMYKILEAMKSGHLEPSLKWATNNQEKLEKIGSDILFKLHQLQYIWIVQNRGSEEGLEYAKTSLSPFATTHLSEFQKLMACLLWAGKLESSPYSEFLSSAHSDKLIEEFKHQFCNLIGQSGKSPLNLTISAGVQGLPTLLKLMTVMNMKKEEWQSMKHLPMPIDLDRVFQFHSVFVCPVSREEASEENPPMLLSCGHVLCNQSIAKLSKNNVSRPFKCPYCPTEVEPKQCKRLFI